jgi:micrococcal nuclease
LVYRHDGDTITCLTAEKDQIRVRLDVINAPELKQQFGQLSKQRLSGLVFGKDVTVGVAGERGQAVGYLHP